MAAFLLLGAAADTLADEIYKVTVFDDNEDHRIDQDDSAWNSMCLAVDYNGNGEIGDGEYALIGKCGVDGITLDLANGEAWSIHTNGAKKIITLGSAVTLALWGEWNATRSGCSRHDVI